MRARFLVGLVAGVGLGYALGWLTKPPERAEPDADVPERVRPAESHASPGAEGQGTRASEVAPTPERTATSMRAPLTAAKSPDAPVLLAPGESTHWSEPAWARQALARAYRKMSKGREMQAEDLDLLETRLQSTTSADALRRTLEHWAESHAREAWKRDQLWLAEGTLPDPPLVVFQSRASSTEMLMGPDPERRDRSRSAEPLDITRPPAAPGQPMPRVPSAYFIRGGVIPRGSLFLIETIDVTVHAGFGRTSREAVRLEFPDGRGPEVPFPPRSLTCRFQGRSVVRAGDEDDVRCQVSSDCGAEVRLAGRLVAEADRTPRPAQPFRMVRFEGDGYLTGDPVLIQVVADHGGGNPRTVHLDGTDNGRFDERSEREVWDGNAPLKELKQARAHIEGCGALPPGKALEVTRVTWRGRRLASESHSELRIQVGGSDVLRLPDRSAGRPPRDGPVEEFVQGSWNGRVVLTDLGRKSVEVTAAYFAMLEARIEGVLVDLPSR